MSRRLYVGLLVIALLIGLPMAVNALGGPELAGTEPAGSGADTTAVGTSGEPGTTYEPASQPNIVFISADDMTLDEMRYLPRVKRLLGQAGVTFTDFTAPQPLCCPSRAQQLTGQYAQNNGVRANSGRYGGYDAFEPETAMPVWLQQAGYHTAMVGKYLNGYKGRDAKEAASRSAGTTGTRRSRRSTSTSATGSTTTATGSAPRPTTPTTWPDAARS
ncbi:MAG: sulfatase-like hydrolase/transferase [Nocardioides sp.]|uniref:sulfatase-like hydrolase/transferase n=1 Tax=Nocardioides sp. TaxID=35761 RepID=UPI002383B4C0|nr:sulfatase-like hydrolase/transferase [Nocardioides sp.]MDE0775974.1 sulfatase-like hydrolase/transferase [Nocardioides sp.]